MKKNKNHQYRKGRRAFGIAAGFLLLVLVIVFILQHDRIEKWYLERTGFAGIRLETGQGQSAPLTATVPAQIPVYSGELSVELNDNIPSFSEFDLTYVSGETYSDLDSLC